MYNITHTYMENNTKSSLPILTDGIKFYQMINPNLTTSHMGVVYFNTNESYEDNAYPVQLTNLYNEGSPVHSSLVNLKRDLLIGNGLKSDDPITNEFLNTTDEEGNSMQTTWEKLCSDYSIFESYSIQIIYNKVGGLHSILHVEQSKVRAKSENDMLNTNIVKTWYVSNNWAKITNKRQTLTNVNNSAIPIANFNPKSWSIDGGRQLAVCRKYIANADVYSIPSYQSVLQYIMLAKELANFHLNKVSGGLFANAIIYLSGNPTDQEKRLFVDQFKRKYQGSNGEKLLFVWGENLELAPKVVPFSTEDNSEVFNELNDIITSHIITAHRATPDLAGIASKGVSLGGDTNKLIAARKYYIETVIKPMRKSMLQTLNGVLSKFGYQDVYVENDELTLDTNKDTTIDNNPVVVNESITSIQAE